MNIACFLQYLDTIIKEAELGKGLKSAEGINTHHLSCRPCSYQSKFVVEMIQHMQCQDHRAKVHQEQKNGSVDPTEIVSAEPDREDMGDEIQNEDKNSAEIQIGQTKAESGEDSVSASVDHIEKQVREIRGDEEWDANQQLRPHTASRSDSLSAIKCPICPEYLDDAIQFQLHLIDAHKFSSRGTSDAPLEARNNTGVTQEAMQTPVELGRQEENGTSEYARADEDASSKDPKVHSEPRFVQDSEDAPTRTASENGTDCPEAFSAAERQGQHAKGTHGSANSRTEQLSDAENRMDVEESPQRGGNGKSDLDAIFSSPRLLLATMCADVNFAARAMKSDRFAQAWESLHPPFSCSVCEETFLKKTDLLDHLTTSSAHKALDADRTHAANAARQEESAGAAPGEAQEIGPRDRAQFSPLGGANAKTDEPRAEEGAETQGISKEAHKKVLVDVGFDQVAHFIENRSPDNRERARLWKMDRADAEQQKGTPEGRSHNLRPTEDDADATRAEKDESPASPQTRTSASACDRCGKEFSNVWILKFHEKSVHNVEMSSETLQEFVRGYTAWYWDGARKDTEAARGDGENEAGPCAEKGTSAQGHDVADFMRRPSLDSATAQSANDDAGFRQSAMQALMKNYPGFLSSYGGALPPHSPQPSSGEQSAIQQQQMVLQMIMAAQAQNAFQQQQQQQQASTPSPSQGNASSVANMLADHLYGAAVHGTTPGFIDPMGVMALLQQQQQSRLPGAAGVNLYQWLTMRYLQQQQQQQMQQLLMYPAMSAGGAGMPFMSGLADNANQQQMLAAFAASLLSQGGMALDPAGPLANAFHTYQLQAAAASLSDGRVKDSDQDSAKMLRMHQREPAAVPPPPVPQQQADIPAKRPRTRITDDQLKILRSNFDINTSPCENQIAEMAMKTNLPPKVIKHWFRNTLFKERQRSKDSPYNFNIPPMTSLDDVNTDVAVSSSGAIGEQSASHLPGSPGSREKMIALIQTGERRSSDQGSAKANDAEGGHVTSSRPRNDRMSEQDAMKFFKSFSGDGDGSSDMRPSFFASMPSFLSGISRPSEVDKVGATDLSRRGPVGDHGDGPNFGHGRTSAQPGDFPFSSIASSHGSMSAITRRTPRTRFSDYQIKVLQEFFDKNAYPKDEDLDKLSRMLDLSTRVIVVWFQNARQKARKSYEMQQQGGAMNASHFSNGLPALNSYPRRRQSPPTSPQQKLAASSRHGLDKPLDMQTGSKNIGQFLRDCGPQDAAGSLSYPPSSIKQELAESSSETGAFKCRQCDASFPTVDAMKQHERLHLSSHMSSVAQHYKMDYPSIIEGMMQQQGSTKREFKEGIVDGKHDTLARRASGSPDREERRPSQDDVKFLTSQPSNNTIGDIISRFGLSNSMRSEKRIPSFESKHPGQNATAMLPAQFQTQGNSIFATKRSMTSPPLPTMSSSLASPTDNRSGGIRRKAGVNDTSKDPKRLRTTITPEQLEFLYQQYLVDSSPSRKVIEQISDIVRLKKRVVQVWFQNTRARERKGQFRSVGRASSILGVPQTCSHCRASFRTKADLDAHVRYRHMQSPSAAAAMSMASQSQQLTTNDSVRNVSGTLLSGSPALSGDGSNLAAVANYQFHSNDIFHSLSKQINETRQAESEASDSAVPVSPFDSLARPGSLAVGEGTDGHPSSPKRRRTSDGYADRPKPFVTSPSSSAKAALSSKTADIYKAVTEQIFGAKSQSSVDAIAQRLQGKAAMSSAYEPATTSAQDAAAVSLSTAVSLATSSASDNRMSSPSAASSPDYHTSSTSPSFMMPVKRHRTQMSSLQVCSLKHCFSEFKTPTLIECETLGAQIGLPKRVIQVWFQNARAKEKKARQGEMPLDQAESPLKAKSSCGLCPDLRFGSYQEYRNHIFSKTHLQNFTNACDGSISDDESQHTSSSDADDCTARESASGRPDPRSTSPSSHDGAASMFRISAIATNGLGSPLSEAQALSQYHQLAAMQQLAQEMKTRNGVNDQTTASADAGVPTSEEAYNNLKQSWFRHRQALLAGRMGDDNKGKPFEERSPNQT